MNRSSRSLICWYAISLCLNRQSHNAAIPPQQKSPHKYSYSANITVHVHLCMSFCATAYIDSTPYYRDAANTGTIWLHIRIFLIISYISFKVSCAQYILSQLISFHMVTINCNCNLNMLVIGIEQSRSTPGTLALYHSHPCSVPLAPLHCITPTHALYHTPLHCTIRTLAHPCTVPLAPLLRTTRTLHPYPTFT